MKTTTQHTALTATTEFRGGQRDLVTVPLMLMQPSTDTYNRLALEDRMADLRATVYVVATEKGAYEIADAITDPLDALYPAESASN